KFDPDGGLALILTGAPQLSVAVGAKLTTAPEGPVASTVWFEGRVRLGAVVSTTVKVVTILLALPSASVAVRVMFVGPSPTGVSGAGSWRVVRLPLLSVAWTRPVRSGTAARQTLSAAADWAKSCGVLMI